MEVRLNGKKLCNAGIDRDDAVLNAIVNVIGQRQAGYGMHIRVGGMENNEFVTWITTARVDILIFIMAGKVIHDGTPSTSVAVSASTTRPATSRGLNSGSRICLNSSARINRHNSHHHFGRPFSRCSLGAQKIRP